MNNPFCTQTLESLQAASSHMEVHDELITFKHWQGQVTGRDSFVLPHTLPLFQYCLVATFTVYKMSSASISFSIFCLTALPAEHHRGELWKMSRWLHWRFHQGSTPILPAMSLSLAPPGHVSPKGIWSLLMLVLIICLPHPEFWCFPTVRTECWKWDWKSYRYLVLKHLQ
jgi:hypothetical protein